MHSTIFFRGECPKCRKHGIFDIINHSSDNETKYAQSFVANEWREYDFFLFTISSKCTHCKLYVSANIAAIHNFEKNSTAEIHDFANENGELITSKELLIEFDYPPLLPPQPLSSPREISLSDLYDQAMHCYKINAWDATGVLCRKIIDIATTKAWAVKFKSRAPNNLAIRIKELFEEKNFFDPKKPLEEQLNYSKDKHRMIYNLDRIRLLGNEAAHDLIPFGKDDAESALAFTEYFFILIQQYESKNKTHANGSIDP